MKKVASGEVKRWEDMTPKEKCESAMAHASWTRRDAFAKRQAAESQLRDAKEMDKYAVELLAGTETREWPL